MSLQKEYFRIVWTSFSCEMIYDTSKSRFLKFVRSDCPLLYNVVKLKGRRPIHTINPLPIEVWCHVLTFIKSPSDWKSLGRTCKYFNSLCGQEAKRNGFSDLVRRFGLIWIFGRIMANARCYTPRPYWPSYQYIIIDLPKI